MKIVGSSGQGINSIGEIIAKAVKRNGYCVFGYREYPSLIKGGHASYQLDIDSEEVRSSETSINLLVCLNYHGLEMNLPDLKENGIVMHITPDWQFSESQKKAISDKKLRVIFVPVEEMLKELDAKPILANTVLTSFVWKLLDQKIEPLKDHVKERFGSKKKEVVEINMRAIDKGTDYAVKHCSDLSIQLPKAKANWKKQLLITGSEAMGLGAIHAGVRFYAGYPMTPSSPLLSFIADHQNETGMVVKQAEDEITAAQMMSGAMFAGTRAMTATSGGGFDLMSETVSMNGIIENPSVFVLAQRPGPATGLPTWTAQADLFLAVHTAHGEFTRCVIAVSDSQDAFDLMPEAFNIAEKYQISVVVMTDKHIAEALYTQVPYDQKKATMKRNLVTDPKELKKLKSSDRYKPDAEKGISPRWLPGSDAETYCAQGDEHNADGTVDESAVTAIQQIDKRMRKLEALKEIVPEPELFGAADPELLLVGWGSTKDAVMDALRSEELRDKKIGYLHYRFLWPLKTQKFQLLRDKAKRSVLVEGNYQGQLGQLLKQETGQSFNDRILKYDGRPFFYDELVSSIATQFKSI